ncbi:MAG TPA: hypothetical protein VFA66_10105 [Gaiellaceae bacterium]|nr:hypothetical protein [Gaiellaceae bacterium]
MLLLAYGFRRQVEVDRAVAEGGFAPAELWVLAALTAAGAVLAALTIALLVSTL